jgi:hypothetical protein
MQTFSLTLHHRILFHSHACSSKSTVAAEATGRLNPATRIRALQNRVSPDTEGVFNDSFWQGLDLVGGWVGGWVGAGDLGS